MPRGLSAGPAYFGLVFAAGFVLGTLRTLWLAPALGELGAVALELPVMLAVSWLACGAVLRRRPLPALPDRAVMGASAFALLMAAEAALALALGVPLPAHLAAYAEAPRALGLAGQIAFALIPLVRRGD